MTDFDWISQRPKFDLGPETGRAQAVVVQVRPALGQAGIELGRVAPIGQPDRASTLSRAWHGRWRQILGRIKNRGQSVARWVAVPPPLDGLPPGDVGAWLDRRPLPRHARRSAVDIDAALALERTAWD